MSKERLPMKSEQSDLKQIAQEAIKNAVNELGPISMNAVVIPESVQPVVQLGTVESPLQAETIVVTPEISVTPDVDESEVRPIRRRGKKALQKKNNTASQIPAETVEVTTAEEEQKKTEMIQNVKNLSDFYDALKVCGVYSESDYVNDCINSCIAILGASENRDAALDSVILIVDEHTQKMSEKYGIRKKAKELLDIEIGKEIRKRFENISVSADQSEVAADLPERANEHAAARLKQLDDEETIEARLKELEGQEGSVVLDGERQKTKNEEMETAEVLKAFGLSSNTIRTTSGNAEHLSSEDDDYKIEQGESMGGHEVVPGSEVEKDVFAAYGHDEHGEFKIDPVSKLKVEVAEMRAKYVKEDYDNTNAWAKLSGFFKLGKKQSGSDMEYWQAQYQNKLIDLQEMELEKLKQSGLAGQELKEVMAGTLRYFKIDESIAVNDARTQYRAENRNWPTKAFDAFGALGRSYNKLSLKQKLALTALLTGGTIVTAASGGTAAGVMATMFIGARKVFSGTGMFVGVEALLEARGQRFRDIKSEKEVAMQADILVEEGGEQSAEADYEQLGRLLKQDIFALDEKLQIEKKKKFFRKTFAATVGVAVGSGWLTQMVMEHAGGNEAIEWIKEKVSDQAAEVVNVSNVPVSGSETVLPVESVSETVVSSDNTAEFLKEHVLTSADGRKGLWGVIESRLPADMPIAEKNVAIQKLESIISGNLGALSPEQLKEVGFGSGNIDTVFAGDTIKFDKVLSAEEIRDVLSGRSVTAAVERSLEESVVTEMPTVDAGVLHGRMSMPEAVVQTGTDRVVQEVVPAKVVEKVALVPRDIFTPQFQPRVNDWYMQIFRVDNSVPGQDWVFDRERIMKLPIRQIFSDMKNGAQLTGLSQEQIGNLASFMEKAKEATGNNNLIRETILADPNATTETFLKKVAPLVKPGQRIGLFTTTQ